MTIIRTRKTNTKITDTVFKENYLTGRIRHLAARSTPTAIASGQSKSPHHSPLTERFFFPPASSALPLQTKNDTTSSFLKAFETILRHVLRDKMTPYLVTCFVTFWHTSYSRRKYRCLVCVVNLVSGSEKLVLCGRRFEVCRICGEPIISGFKQCSAVYVMKRVYTDCDTCKKQLKDMLFNTGQTSRTRDRSRQEVSWT